MWAERPNNRIIIWREFRERISKLQKEQALEETARFWGTCPISTQYLAADLPEDWPDPWMLLHDNYYDDIAITLGMVYTLTLASDQFDDAEIRILCHSSGAVFHTAWFENGKYIINYEYGTVVSLNDLQSDLFTKYKYSYKDLNIENYK